MQRRFVAIDYVKYIASIFVIGIHVNLFNEFNPMLNFITVHIIFRLAVPFFAISTGFLIAEKKKANGDNNSFKLIIIKQFKKMIRLYMIWSSVYLVFSIPSWIRTGWFSINAFVDFFLATAQKGSHYHLWYLASLIYALPVVYLLTKLEKIQCLKIVIVIMWVIKVCSYGYINWMPDIISNFFCMTEPFSAIFDAIFCITPLIGIGIVISCEEKKSLVHNIMGFGLSFALLVVEAVWLKNLGCEKVSFIFMTLPSAYYLFNIVISFKNIKITKYLGALSLYIYCVHPIFIELLIERVKINSIIFFCMIIVLSTMIAYVLMKMKDGILRTRYKNKN